MFIIQFIASFIGVVAFAINIEIPKKYICIVGGVGAIGWLTYLVCIKFNLPNILAYFLSALLVTIISMILSKTLKAISTIFLIPGILPIVPGAAMYEMIYSLINNNIQDAKYYLFQAILIAGGIALAIFITGSIKDVEIIRKEKINEDKI